MKQPVIVKNSKIHGKGVFANKDFKKGEIVIKWNPKYISKEEVNKLPAEEIDFVSYKEGKYILMQEPERFVNHSCNPNTNSINSSDVAIKEIKNGDEITSDYSKDVIPGFKMKCNCGSKNCRGVIENAD
jgi:uncharacterized protein